MKVSYVIMAGAALTLGSGGALAQQDAPAGTTPATVATPASPAEPATPPDPLAGTEATPATPATIADPASPSATSADADQSVTPDAKARPSKGKSKKKPR